MENEKCTHKPRRNSSIELFRILATFLVIIVHLNSWMAVEIPEYFDFENVTMYRVVQVIIQSCSIVCVNCFIIISGFYGVKLKGKTIWNMYVLLISIYIPCYFVSAIYHNNFTIGGLIDNILALSHESYFVQNYLMLVFLSPIINTFLEKYQKQATKYIISLVLIEWWFDCVRDNNSLGFGHGFSIMHFITIYLLARLVFYYQEYIIKIRWQYWLLIYVGCCIIIGVMYLSHIKYCWAYSNPIVVLSSFCLFFPFLYKNTYFPIINKIAKSTFSVYILHTYGIVLGGISYINRSFLENYNLWVYLCLEFLLAVAIFVVGIFYDRLRIRLIGPITDKVYSFIKQKILLEKLI